MEGDAMFVEPGEGAVADLGVTSMRLLVDAEQTRGALGAAEFSGRRGAWTVPHQHLSLEECFYVLSGAFAFECGSEQVEAAPGAFVMVPRGTRHLLTAVTDEASLLVLWTPGGLEQMFLELARLDHDSLTDPAARAAVSRRFDSIPV
jgi:quercetin dioxygenase-like cupin family protein